MYPFILRIALIHQIEWLFRFLINYPLVNKTIKNKTMFDHDHFDAESSRYESESINAS